MSRPGLGRRGPPPALAGLSVACGQVGTPRRCALSFKNHLRFSRAARDISSAGYLRGATVQSALGWYRPSVGVPETLDGINVTQAVYFFN